MDNFITLNAQNLEKEHLCCAIADQKHQLGVIGKKDWLKKRLSEGHVFYKLDARGKVFIEYAPLETAWVPIKGDNYLYIYCLWVSGSFSKKGYAKALLEHCLADAKKQNKAGVCVLTAKKKKPFLADKKFFQHFGFQVVDNISEFELLALSFKKELPEFLPNAKTMVIPNQELTIYYSLQCPYVLNCLQQVQDYCHKNKLPLTTIAIDSLEKAKNIPSVFNNWAVFYQGKYVTNHLLNETFLKKKLNL